jgi:hypothetical protein
MRFLKESLLSFFVVGVVLSLYFLAAGAALFSFCGFVSHRDKAEPAQHLKITANVTSLNQIHTIGELQ